MLINPASMNVMLQDFISTPQNIKVENKPPRPVKVPISGVKSCQEDKKKENIFTSFITAIMFQLTFSLDTPETSDFLR